MLIIQPNGVSPTSCFGSKTKGCAVTKQRMSLWLVEAISLAYEACGLASPLGVRAHSTRAWLCRKPSLVDLLWMIYVLWQDGPHRALLSNSTAWMWGRPTGFFPLDQMLSSDPSYLRYIRHDGIAFHTVTSPQHRSNLWRGTSWLCM